MDAGKLSRILSMVGSQKQKENFKGITSTCPLSYRHKGGEDSHPSFFSYYSNAKADGVTSWCYCHACNFKGTISDLVTELSINLNKDLSHILHEIYLSEWTDSISDLLDIPKYDEVPNHVKVLKTNKNNSSRKNDCSFFVFNNGSELPLILNGNDCEVVSEDIAKMCSGWIGVFNKYYIKRGLSEDDINRWSLGYTPKITYKRFKNKKWYYTVFLNRIVFIIKDQFNNIVGWSARRINDSDKLNNGVINGMPAYINIGGPKYLHAQGFNKTDYLYGMNLVSKESDTAILCEGQIDAIKIDKAGFLNSMALLGGDLSDKQVKYLVDNFKRVIFFEDGDKSGVDICDRARSKLVGNLFFEKVDSKAEGYYEEKNCKDPGDMNKEKIGNILNKFF